MHTEIMRKHRHFKPKKEIDHRNGCGCDNQKENLRVSTRATNAANCKEYCRNKSGTKGIWWNANLRRWKAFIGINGKSKTLGRFVNKTDAIACRQRAEIDYYKEYRHDPTNVCPLEYTGECPDCAARLGELTSS